MLSEALPDAVDAELKTFFASRREQTVRVDGHFAEAVDALEAFVLRGGKRMRPRFAWWGWRGAGGDPSGTSAAGVLVACAALELIQACALVHDDLVDASATRSGHCAHRVRCAPPGSRLGRRRGPLRAGGSRPAR